MSHTRRKFLRRGALAAAAGIASPLLKTRLLASAPAASAPAVPPPPSHAADFIPPAPAPISAPADFGVCPGPFQPGLDSLARYTVPDWYRDAKFGLWAHWGPQCVPEQGDWYARSMYQEGSRQYNFHTANYGHPSKFGFKDIDNLWKAESWDPQKLVGLYKRAGAKFFAAMANHHDNLDFWDSTYQPWNTVRVGPKKDLIAGWEKAARAAGLRFAVTCHAAHAWTWFEGSQLADRNGPLAGVPYDGKLTKADGKGQWWEGLDPQDLYAQYHARSERSENFSSIHSQWAWGNGASVPDAAYCEKFFNRTVELINKYNPDLLYFDDTILPLHPVSDAGLRIAAYYYNRSIREHGKLDVVLTGKVLEDPALRKCMVWDVERGAPPELQPLPWQTDTCIGEWHYRRSVFEQRRYKTPETVARMLLDIVSKNGCLMLNIPLPGNGAPDSEELAFLAAFTTWMDRNGPGIYGTRPWRVYGEGPSVAAAAANPIRAQGFNEGRARYTAGDFRFMQKDGALYAFALGWPEDGKFVVKSLAEGAATGAGKVERVELLGMSEPLVFTRDAAGLSVTLPAQKVGDYAYGLKISGTGLTG